MRLMDVRRVFRRYADKPETIPPLVVALALRDARVEPSEENELKMRNHLQQVFWAAAENMEALT